MTITVSTITGAAKSYVEVFFRRKWLFFVPTILFFTVALAYSFTIPSKYRTSTVILVEEEKISNPLISGLAVSSSVRDRLETIIKILLSRPLLEQVISELTLDQDTPSNDPAAFEKLVTTLRENITVQLYGRDILKINSEDRDPVVCQKIANSITTLFIKHNLELQMRETNAGIEFLKTQRTIYEKKLLESEKALREFKEKYQGVLSTQATQELGKMLSPQGVSTPPVVINTEILRYSEFKGDLVKLNLDLKEAVQRRGQLRGELTSESEYVISERSVDPVVLQLENDLTVKLVELAKLRVDATEQHPTVARLTKEIDDLKTAIKSKRTEKVSAGDKEVLNPYHQQIRAELSRLDRDIESLKTRIKLTELYLDNESAQIKSIPRREAELSSLQRDYAVNGGIYQDLSSKLETAYITQRLEMQEKGTKFRVVEPARVPLEPYKPNRKFMGIAGAVLGMLIGAGLISLAEMTDHSFTEINQLRTFLNIPVLASISQILTIEEVDEIRARRKLWAFSVVSFVVFSLLGAIIRYYLYRKV